MRIPCNCRGFSTGAASVAAVLVLGLSPLRAADPALIPAEQKEEFLRKAHVQRAHTAAKGITQTVRVTMTDGNLTHDASVQRINEHKNVFQPDSGPPEVNFKDSYKYNVAAWKLSRLLGIDDMMPPSIERKYEGTAAAYTWWIDDVMMDEVERTSKKLTAPDLEKWNEEMYVVRVFDQLIYNTDRNLTNLLIDKQWRIWMIDHTRAFRTRTDLRNSQNLVKCDRKLMAKMKALDQGTLEKELMPYLDKLEIKGILARRNLIVKFFEEKGESALYDRPSRQVLSAENAH